MRIDRVFPALLAAALVGMALLFSGCTSVPKPVKPTVTEPEPPADSESEPAAHTKEVTVAVKKSAPVVNLHVPETSRNPALGEYPLQIEVRAKKDGSDETAAAQVLFEQDLLDLGLSLAAPGKMGHEAARIMVRLDLKAWKVMDLGAGRVQVHGDGEVAVDRKADRLPLYRAPLSAKSGANLTEVRATKQVLDEMCTAAAELVHRKVSEYAVETSVKVVALDTAAEEVDLETFCVSLEDAIRAENSVVLVGLEKDASGKSAKFTLWLGKDFNGDLAGLFRENLEQSGTDNHHEVEVNVDH